MTRDSRLCSKCNKQGCAATVEADMHVYIHAYTYVYIHKYIHIYNKDVLLLLKLTRVDMPTQSAGMLDFV
jgi:hypothetical protein